MSYTCEKSLNNIAKFIKILALLGFVVLPTKSLFTSSQKIEYLGFDLNSISMTISLTDPKKRVLVELCDYILAKIQSYKFQLIYHSNCIIPSGRLRFRGLQSKNKALKENKGNFDKFTEISDIGKADIT